jgi:hypothetical protein
VWGRKMPSNVEKRNGNRCLRLLCRMLRLRDEKGWGRLVGTQPHRLGDIGWVGNSKRSLGRVVRMRIALVGGCQLAENGGMVISVVPLSFRHHYWRIISDYCWYTKMTKPSSSTVWLLKLVFSGVNAKGSMKSLNILLLSYRKEAIILT